jgi:serine O-acetyltransferase
LASLRAYQKWSISTNPIAMILKKFAVLRHRFWSLITRADIPLNCKISGGLLIPHPNGIVIHPDALIGPNCIIFQQVTLGTRNDLLPPTIGACVEIGAGAKIIGPINIGNFVKIGANAVVLTNVPDGKTAVGIPASIIN